MSRPRIRTQWAGLNRTSKFGEVFLFIFALPFAGFGLFALVKSIQDLMGAGGPEPFWLPLIFGIAFTGVGFGLMFMVIFGSRLVKKRDRAQAEHPSEPWLWRDDWAQGRVVSNTRSSMIGAWVFALFWNVVSAPIIFFLPREAAKKPVAYIGLIFPIAGLFLLVRAIRYSLEYAEFGRTVFEMSSVPGVIGGELKGVIQSRFPHSPEHGVQLRLTCVRRVTTGSGNSRSTSEYILWRGETNLPPVQPYPGPSGTSIPINIRIPWDSIASDNQNSDNQVVWLLEARADVPGIDYDDVFEVPVFRTSQTPAQAPADVFRSSSLPISRPNVATISVQQVEGGTEFFFPAARNKSFGISSFVFLTIFAATTYFLHRVRVPFIFPLAFGGFSVLLAYINMQMWLGTTRVTIGNGLVRVQTGYLGGGKIVEVAFADVAQIDSRIRAQQGGGTGTPYYNIELTQKNGRKVTLGSTLPSQQETQWLVQEMQRLVGLHPMAAGATAQ
jgi:hypothetical protein